MHFWSRLYIEIRHGKLLAILLITSTGNLILYRAETISFSTLSTGRTCYHFCVFKGFSPPVVPRLYGERWTEVLCCSLAGRVLPKSAGGAPELGGEPGRGKGRGRTMLLSLIPAPCSQTTSLSTRVLKEGHEILISISRSSTFLEY